LKECSEHSWKTEDGEKNDEDDEESDENDD
jgi:hypothetical protein